MPRKSTTSIEPSTPDSAAMPDRRRSHVLAAASAVIQAKGYAAATTLDIATAAGVSKRDLYALFPTKVALLEAMIRDGVADMTKPIALQPARNRADVYQGLSAFGDAFLTRLLSPSVLGLYRIAVAEAPASPVLGRLLIEAGAGTTKQVVSDFVAAALKAGHVRFEQPAAAIGVFFHVLLGDLRLQALLAPDHPVAPEAVRRQVGLAVLALKQMDLARDG
jgi:AcrR family transcriptional regulator